MAHYQLHYKFVGLQFSQQKSPRLEGKGVDIKSFDM